jgi:hypothetical protein
VRTEVKFEVIKSMDDSHPYPTLLGIDWAFHNYPLLNLKKRQMLVETDTLHMVSPLDPNEGDRYNEPVDEYVHIFVTENVYKIIGCKEDDINTTTCGELNWWSVKSHDTDFEDSMERWQQKLYEAVRKNLDPTNLMDRIWWMRLLVGCNTILNTTGFTPLIYY